MGPKAAYMDGFHRAVRSNMELELSICLSFHLRLSIVCSNRPIYKLDMNGVSF